MRHNLDDTALISGPSARCRAYAQMILKLGILPKLVLYQPGKEWDWRGEKRVNVDLRGNGRYFIFYPNETARVTLARAEIPFCELPAQAIDDERNLTIFRGLSTKILIFSGYGTGIMRPSAFNIGKRFLHVHGGYVPQYRGSTAFYYSILEDGSMGASAIWMNSGIDTGPVLARHKYPLQPGINIDYILDPLVRADTLGRVLENRVQKGVWPKGLEIPESMGQTYHKIHPVLKHLALRRAQLVKERR